MCTGPRAPPPHTHTGQGGQEPLPAEGSGWPYSKHILDAKSNVLAWMWKTEFSYIAGYSEMMCSIPNTTNKAIK